MRNSKIQKQPDPQQVAADFLNGHPLLPEWITKGADSSLVDFAEQAGKFMADNKLTTSKIRSFYGEIKRIQMGTFDKEKSSFYLLRPKIAYALGRELQGGNKNNCAGLYLFKMIFDEASRLVNDQKSFNNLSNLMEAILAYHKAHKGK